MWVRDLGWNRGSRECGLGRNLKGPKHEIFESGFLQKLDLY